MALPKFIRQTRAAGHDPVLIRSLAALAAVIMAASLEAAPAPGKNNLVEQGRRIYQEGILPSGTHLVGERVGQGKVEGHQAACINCHRRSGMGSVEGNILVSPITGNYLFGSDRDPVATMDPQVGKRFSQRHAAYTDLSLAETLRSGVNNGGRPMNVVMPHYQLGKRDMAALIAYLRQLSVEPSPGVSDDAIQFATVIAPGVEPARRQAMLDIVQAVVNQKNGSTVVGTQRGGRRHMVTAAEMILGTERKWQVQTWELQGPPETWGKQLRRFYAKQPVFALVAGVSDTTWQPVHDFCQQEQVPCWFPSVALPPPEPAYYPVYFSAGVRLEAAVLARHLRDQGNQKPRRMVQIFRDDELGRGAAERLRQLMTDSGTVLEDRALKPGDPAALGQALADLGSGDAVMFWLRRADLSELGKLPVQPNAATYFSGELAGGESAPFGEAWKSGLRLIYPYEMPEKRLLYMRTFHSWLNMRRLALVDEPLQAQTFFAMRLLTDTVSEMLNNLYRDYLLDRAENMLSRSEGAKSEQQAREVATLGRPEELARRFPKARPLAETVHLPPGVSGALAGQPQSTSLYPRLSLGIGQRFASKGAYIVRFGDGGKLVPDSDWIVP